MISRVLLLFYYFSVMCTLGENNSTVDWSTLNSDLDMPSDVKFIVFTRNRPTGTEDLGFLKKNRYTYGLIHGFNDSPRDSYMIKELVDAYLSRENCNIIAVDWTPLAQGPFYPAAVYNTLKVGNALSRFLLDSHLPLHNVTLVGFSLGAHVAGITGKSLDGRLGRIVGLDPAGVAYANAPSQYRIDAQDARLVEVVHTSAGCLGLSAPLGTRDFFPNGGTCPQPGCEPDPFYVCSHRRAYYYYAEAVRDPKGGFKGRRCPSFNDFRSHKCKVDGKATILRLVSNDTELRGNFYFVTNPKAPFIKFRR